MFNPSRADVRQFFCELWRKRKAGEVVSPLEARALKWVDTHPEYQRLLDNPQDALHADFSIERGQSNPFLHLSMHLAIEEQLSIDQPRGIRALFERLAARGDEHAAHHQVMDCLGRVLWELQRGALPADAASVDEAYLGCLKRLVGAST